MEINKINNDYYFDDSKLYGNWKEKLKIWYLFMI